MGSLYFWGHSIQEMGGNVVIGRSIYGSLFYGNKVHELDSVSINVSCMPDVA